MSDNLPYCESAEMGLLGCLFSMPELVTEMVQRRIDQSYFYNEINKIAYQEILSMVAEGKRPDSIQMMDRMKQAGHPVNAAWWKSYTEATPNPFHWDAYLETIVQWRLWRQTHTLLLEAKDEINSLRTDEVPDFCSRLERKLSKMTSERESRRSLKEGEIGRAAKEYVLERVKLKGALPGFSYGIPRLDRLTLGIHRKEMVVIGARPNVGKTAFGGTILLTAAESPDPVPTLFVSLDVSAVSIANRLTAGSAQVDITSLRSGWLAPWDMERVDEVEHRLKSVYIEEATSGLRTSGLLAMVQSYVRDHGVGMVIVDYLQKIKPDGRHEKKTYEVGEVSGVLKDIALECNVAMVALCQLNRDAEDQDRTPQMRDLADSGQIERDADAIILLHRKRGEVDGPSKLLVVKQRDGEVGMVDSHFIGRYCRFYPAETKLETE